MSERRIGVYICHCGGNISDVVDVAQVKEALKDEADVVVAETSLFACSDGTQQDIVQAIQDQHLDGLVVASCSPKLHLFTFRGVSKRAGLNPYAYTQVDIREQDSWAHGDDPAGATRKAIGLVRAGVAKTRLTTPLQPTTVETTPKTMVIGAGIAGLRAAIGLADMGLGVFLVEREKELGGWVARFGPMYPHERDGRRADRPTRRGGSQAAVDRRVHQRRARREVGQLRQLRRRGAHQRRGAGDHPRRGGLDHRHHRVRRVRSPRRASSDTASTACSRCPSSRHSSTHPSGALVHNGQAGAHRRLHLLRGQPPARRQRVLLAVLLRGDRATPRSRCRAATRTIHQYHLYRDIRTYGKYELMYTESRKRGSVYMKFPDDTPPAVARDDAGQLTVTTRDTLTGGEELTIAADLVVLVTGMVPRKNEALVKILKLPVGGDGFFNEIHPKLRPVETIVDGVLIAGTCQSPKSASESVASALAAVTQSGAILKRGVAELDPLVATVNSDACTWCGLCLESCPYAAIEKTAVDGREVATDHVDHLQGLRWLHPDLPPERDRPARAAPTPRCGR